MYTVEASRRDNCRLQVPAPFQAQRRTCPLPPAPPFVRDRGADFVTVAWYTPVTPPVGDGESSVLRYQVSFSADANSVASGWKPCYEGREEMCTIFGLAAGRQYRVRVLALNSAGASGFSGESFCSTAPGPPDAPPAPAALAVTSSSVVLQWTSPDHDGGSSVGRYRLEMRHLDIAPSTEGELTGEAFELVYEGRQPQFLKRGLQPGKTYECRVQAMNKFGGGVWSPSSKFSTDWQADRDQPSALIGLEPPALHASRVHAHNEGKPENSSIAATAVLLPPSAPHLLVRGSQSLKLRWEAPKGSHCEVVTSYTLQKFEGMEGDLSHDTGEQSKLVSGWAWVDVYTGSGLESEVSSLEPDRPYCFRVMAHSKHGASLPGETTTVSTDAAEQDPVPCLTTVAPVPAAAQAPLDSCTADSSTDSSVAFTASPLPQPAAPKLIHTSATSLSVLWRSGGNGATRGSEWEEESRAGNVTYELEMAVPAIGKTELIYTGPESWHEVKNLAPNCLYKFRVRATAGAISSDWSLFSDVSVSAAKAPSRLDFMLFLSSKSWSLPVRRLIATLSILLVLGAALCQSQPVCVHMGRGDC